MSCRLVKTATTVQTKEVVDIQVVDQSLENVFGSLDTGEVAKKTRNVDTSTSTQE